MQLNNDNLKPAMKKIVNMLEFERFKMGLGAYEFAEHLGMHYHTYYSFLKQNKKTNSLTFGKVYKFLQAKKVNIDSIWQAYMDEIK